MAHSDMKGIHPSIASHRLNVFSTARPVRQRIRRFHPEDKESSGMRLTNCSKPDSSKKFLSRLVGKRSSGTKKRRKMASLYRLHQPQQCLSKRQFSLATNRSDCGLHFRARDALFLGCLLRISSNPHVPG
ncbi:hypothetical protein CK203_027555 [Vitis vinifera]|uniref:Uncharacterized protein n=1 Tax=Vitis vinifera TaxID=29760 RepID=A0A438JBI9_VITVI|nr:hypothetical protein CK203_027555 [Vitis vinifera]